MGLFLSLKHQTYLLVIVKFKDTTHSQMCHTGRGVSAGRGYQECGRISIPWFPESQVTWKVVLHSKKLTADTGPKARII